MNRIEQTLDQLKKKREKAFITYMTAGLPSMEGCKNIILAQGKAGTDILEIGIPFSDPVADGPVIQAASYEAILRGTNLKKVFQMIGEVRADGCEIPIVFMMYYNTILYYGIEKFVQRCKETGVDGLIVPDLPLEEQEELQTALDQIDGPILIQLVSPVSKHRIPKILEHARGFVYCVSSMGVTGQSASFHKDVIAYLKEVKEHASIPVMMGFGIRTPEDVEPMMEYIDGAIVGSHFITIMKESDYSRDAVVEYCRSFKQGLLNYKEEK